MIGIAQNDVTAIHATFNTYVSDINYANRRALPVNKHSQATA